jgi:hypothetical protein
MKAIMLALLAMCAAEVALAQPPGTMSGTAPSQAASQEPAVLAAVDEFFAAVHDKSRERIAAATLAEGLATSIRPGSSGQQPLVRSWHWATYIENVLGGRGIWTERLFAPVVQVDGDIAMVWSRYELLVDGVFDHCGVDHFDMVRRGERWVVYNLTWTNVTVGCPGR